MSTITIPAIPYPSEIRPLRPRRRYRRVLLFILAIAAGLLLTLAWPTRAHPAGHNPVTHSLTAAVHQPAAHAAKGVTVTVNGTAFACAIPKPPKRH